jgi:hypothetical protein
MGDTKIDLKVMGYIRVWIGFDWLRIESSGGWVF